MIIPSGARVELANESLLAPSPVVAGVFDFILAAIHRGELVPGERISDGDLATHLGVSRTPVREALLRLREIGVIEASASRFTRVAVVTPEQTQQAFIVWLALFKPLIREVIPTVAPGVLAVMEADHDAFLAGMKDRDAAGMASANYLLFSRLQEQSHNPALKRALTSVVHIIRLGALHLPEYLDIQSLSATQKMLLEAARDHDLKTANGALDRLKLIVPQE